MKNVGLILLLVSLFAIAALYDFSRWLNDDDETAVEVELTDYEYSIETNEARQSRVYRPERVINSKGDVEVGKMINLKGKYLLVEYNFDNCIEPEQYKITMRDYKHEWFTYTSELVCPDIFCEKKYALFRNLTSTNYALHIEDFQGAVRSIDLNLEYEKNLFPISRFENNYYRLKTPFVNIIDNSMERLAEQDIRIEYRGRSGGCIDLAFRITTNEDQNKIHIESNEITISKGEYIYERQYNSKNTDAILKELKALEGYIMNNELQFENTAGYLKIEGAEYYANYEFRKDINEEVLERLEDILQKYFPN